MKNILIKKLIIFIIFSGIVLLSFNYTHTWHLINQVPKNDFDRVEIHELHSNNTYVINDKNKIANIYNYLFDRKCQKVEGWFSNGLHYDGENYRLIFLNKKDYLFIYLLEPDYIKIGDKPFFVDSSFDFKTLNEYIMN
ncbi:hypothetical protein [Abyssisolibacter fermentans]|uniref:hypothetical protein n=1 Tax=Abyssisolibacter fermentans TaxID=1766203 RepID=UPI00082C5A50|nr:hypothetical protein [Abyssisolibacter fermentans]